MIDSELNGRNWPRIWALMGLFSGGLAAIGAYGSGFGFWHFTIGFLMIGVALLLAFIAIIGGAFSILRHGRTLLRSVGVVVALGLWVIIGQQIWHGTQVPPIHDISTNTAFPPQFEHLPPRADLYAGLNGGIEEWRQLHRAAYADIQPLTFSGPPDPLMPRVTQLVHARGWDVAYADAGRIEATDTVSPFRFKDDIVIVARFRRQTRAGSVTTIDIRSISRVGRSDLGMNARRVRALMRDIVALEASR
jgi:uncharacterized protein (DUF1499 family)